MYARLAFSIAIHVDPEILIVDEALAVGDSRFVAKCMRRIKEIQQRGATILFVSHDVGSVRTLCDRAIWLDKGRLVEDGDVFPVTGKYMEFMFKDRSIRGSIFARRYRSEPGRSRATRRSSSYGHARTHKRASQAIRTRTGCPPRNPLGFPQRRDSRCIGL